MCHFFGIIKIMNDESPLFLAIIKDQVDEVTDLTANYELIDKGIPIQTGSAILHSKPSPLSVSCFYGSTESFRYLLNSGASIEHEDLNKI
ncbi:hypothetical protein M9Y10_034303 [Tritrichomonas musculus]|uniref:Ankyrin repeat protein n=1 Tax=Tritrichomonas musculus TaxID=1915356 RepID=A0ABR2KEJ1_9EUKA